MIKRLPRYIAHHVISSTALFSLMLLGVDFFIVCINEMRLIGEGDYGLLQVLLNAFLQLPAYLYQFFPMAALVGCLMGLGGLASSSELIVMRTSTMSVMQITRAVCMGALVILSVVTVLGEVVAPTTSQWASTRKTIAISGGQALAIGHGAWFRSRDTFINVEKIMSPTHLQGIHWYKLDNHLRLLEAGVARFADYHNTHWQLRQVARSFMHANATITAKHAKLLSWHVDLAPRLLSLTESQPNDMTLPKLWAYIDYLKQNKLPAHHEQLVFWQRVLQPLATLVMVLLAIPFIFGPLRAVPVGARIVVGCAVGFMFYFANQLFGLFSSVYQVPPLLAASIPILIFIAVGLLLVWRVR